MRSERVTLRFADRDYIVDIGVGAGGSGNAAATVQVRVDGELVVASMDRQRVRVDDGAAGPAWAIAAGDVRWVFYDGCVYEIEVQREGRRRRMRPPGSLSAPMPATVRQVRVAVGQMVALGDTLIVLEAMKMELPVRADADGTVAAIHCTEGELVQPGRPLIELTAAAGA